MFRLFRKKSAREEGLKASSEQEPKNSTGAMPSEQQQQQINGRGSSRFHPPDLENTSKALYTSLHPSQFSWSLKNGTGSSGGWITETQTFYALSNTGELVYLQLAYSNLSWPAQTICQITARYFNREGTNRFGTWTVPASRLRLDAVRTSCSARSTSFSQKEPLDGNVASFRVQHGCDSDEPIILDLDFKGVSQPFAIHDGCIHFGRDRMDGYIQLKFIPAARVTGSVRLDDGSQRSFDGWGFIVRQFQGLKPYLSASRWNLFYFCTGDRLSKNSVSFQNTSLFMLQLITPEPYDRIAYNIGCIWREDRLLAVSIDNQISEVSPVLDLQSKYTIPRAFQYRWKGVTFEGEPFQASCQCETRTVVTKECVLDSLPFVLRKVIEAFIPRPYIFQWTDETTVSIDLAGSVNEYTGWAFQELSIISE